MKAVIISIGDELVLGQVADTNAAFVSSRLVEMGIMPQYHQTLPDELQAVVKAVKHAATKADLVIITGGLGPTQDDLTRQAIAAAMGVSMVFHQPSFNALKRFFKKRGRVMSENNRIQATFPKGSAVLENPLGTAPGFMVQIDQAKVIVLPGVPREMKVMFARHFPRLLKRQTRNRILTMQINSFGLGESVVAEKLGALMRRDRNPLVGTTASGGVISIRIRGEFTDAKKGAREMRETAAQIQKRLGEYVFGEGDITLAETVGRMLVKKNKTLATAESCTAGLLAAMITEIPGASKYFLGGWVVYANRLKSACLDVPQKLIERDGAVSETVAKKMASGALLASGADYALAITGIAGPTGGTSQKPVGTVWIALAEKNKRGLEVSAEIFFFGGERSFLRELAAKRALNILRLRLMRS
jgi:nicotinamide-nucleotide amidase